MRQVSFNSGKRTVEEYGYECEQYEWIVTFDEEHFYLVSYVSQTPGLTGPETMVFTCDKDGHDVDWINYVYKNDLHTPQLGRDDAFAHLKFQYDYMQ